MIGPIIRVAARAAPTALRRSSAIPVRGRRDVRRPDHARRRELKEIDT